MIERSKYYLVRTHPKHPCTVCKKPAGEHRALTFQCPRGPKSRIGYLGYSSDRFVPLAEWVPKPGFTL